MGQQIISFHNTPIANDFHFESSVENAPELAINRINILVGANNAGKSRFMREIMKLPYLFTENPINIYKNIELKQKQILQCMLSEKVHFEVVNKITNQITKIDDVFFKDFLKNISNILAFSHSDNFLTYLRNIELLQYVIKDKNDNNIDIKKQNKMSLGVRTNNANSSTPIHYPTYPISEIREIIRLALPKYLSFKKTYIPTLRSAVTFVDGEKGVFEVVNKEEKNKNLFKTTVKHNYELPDDLDIFTGRDLYETILESKNSDESVRKEFKKFEKFIGETFFGKTIEITSIYSEKHDKRHIKVAFEGEQERELHNYGDGIQTLMLLTYKLFMAKEGEWIFIEEPELNLHPALQREFLRLITENEDIKAKNLRIFFTTHSNHLLDLTITGNDDISIFVFERERETGKVISKSKIREVSHTDLKILHELGVHNSSVFLANCSIWVEGITDRMYVKAYLQAYLTHKNEANRWKEDRHYSFFEYAGSNIVHYTFDDKEESDLIKADFIAKHVLLIADDDKNKDVKHQRFATQLGDNYLKVGVKEIEHLLSPKQLKAILPKMNFDGGKDITDINLAEIVFDINIYQDENATYLPKYLGNMLEKQGLSVPDALQKDSTFSPKQKEKLATIVVNDIKNKNIKWEDLSEKAKEFIIKIYDFIEAKNEGVIN